MTSSEEVGLSAGVLCLSAGSDWLASVGLVGVAGELVELFLELGFSLKVCSWLGVPTLGDTFCRNKNNTVNMFI